MQDLFQPVIDALHSLKELRENVMSRLQTLEDPDGQKLDLSVNVSNTGCSVTEIDLRIAALLDLASCISPEQNTLMIPRTSVTGLKKQIDFIVGQYQNIEKLLNQLESEGGGVGKIVSGSLEVKGKKGDLTASLDTHISDIWNHSDAALVALYHLLQILRADSFGDFASAYATFAGIVQTIQKEREEFSELTREGRKGRDELAQEGQKIVNQLNAIKDSSDSLNKELSRLKSEGDSDRKTLAEYASEGTEKVASIRHTNTDSEQLKQAVESYQAQFQNFQKQLNEREKALKDGTDRQTTLLTNLEEIKTQIVETNERSEKMLSGATVAGLAGSFGDLRNAHSKELRGARWVFYLSILVLFFSVIPLVAYVLPGPLEKLGMGPNGLTPSVQEGSALEVFAQVVARALLLIPAAWFAKFAAARHAALFRLKEHYAYKYSVASSVDGFKQQARPFQDEIAAATFFELTFNPADRMEGKGSEERHPNPAMEWVMKKLGFTHDGRE